MNINQLQIKSAALPYYQVQGDGLPAPQDKTFQQLVQLFKGNTTVSACVTKWAQTMGEAPLLMRQGDTLTDNHELIRLFNRPNKYQSLSQFINNIGMFCALSGNAYIHKVRAGRKTVEMYVYSDKHVQPIVNSQGDINEYLHTLNNVKTRIPASDIIHLRSHIPDPDKPHMGLAPLLLVQQSASINATLDNALYLMLDNGGIPPAIFSYKGQSNLSEGHMTSIKDSWRKFKAALSSKRKDVNASFILPTNVDLLTTASNFKEYDLPNLWTRLDTAICSAYAVPPTVAGVFGGMQQMTYNNVKEGYKQFTELLRIPLWNTWEEQISISFQDEYQGIVLEFDLSVVAALQPDPQHVQENAIKAYDSGFITMNEARNAFGYATVPNGDTYKQPTITPVLSNPSKRFKSAESSVWESYGITEEKAASTWKVYDTIANQAVEEMQDSLYSVISKLGEHVVQANKQKVLFDYEAWEKKFIKATEKAREKMILSVIKQAWTDSDSLDNLGDAENNIAVSSTAESAEKIKESIGTIREEVKQILKDNAGKTASEIADILKAKFDTLAVSRAATIARTTATSTVTGTQKKVWSEYNDRQTDDNKKIVRVGLTQRDEDVRHPEFDGQAEDENGMFTIGGDKTDRPAGSGLSAEHACNCRCTTIAIKRSKLKR